MEFDWGHDLDVIRMQVSEKVDQLKPELPEQTKWAAAPRRPSRRGR